MSQLKNFFLAVRTLVENRTAIKFHDLNSLSEHFFVEVTTIRTFTNANIESTEEDFTLLSTVGQVLNCAKDLALKDQRFFEVGKTIYPQEFNTQLHQLFEKIELPGCTNVNIVIIRFNILEAQTLSAKPLGADEEVAFAIGSLHLEVVFILVLGGRTKQPDLERSAMQLFSEDDFFTFLQDVRILLQIFNVVIDSDSLTAVVQAPSR